MKFLDLDLNLHATCPDGRILLKLKVFQHELIVYILQIIYHFYSIRHHRSHLAINPIIFPSMKT